MEGPLAPKSAGESGSDRCSRRDWERREGEVSLAMEGKRVGTERSVIPTCSKDFKKSLPLKFLQPDLKEKWKQATIPTPGPPLLLSRKFVAIKFQFSLDLVANRGCKQRLAQYFL